MYKHMADSIKETAQKRFISQEDKDKYDGYEESEMAICINIWQIL